LQEFVPGAANQVDLRDRIEMKQKIDSLESIAQMMTRERENLQAILKGEPLNNPGSASDSLPETEDLNLEEISESEKKFRKMMEEEFTEDGLNGAEKISGNTLKNLAFFTPIRGFISDTFDKKSNHLAVDIVAPKNAPVKATLDGSVVISTWTPETGHVIAIQHSNDLISVYKHNSVLLKKTGAYVSAGEVIALVGNSGELTTGPHLHFELWYNGSPVDPRYYLNF
jgi:murein DD-endopeptidase MepM/ murein hydrolase activator NlpD